MAGTSPSHHNSAEGSNAPALGTSAPPAEGAGMTARAEASASSASIARLDQAVSALSAQGFGGVRLALGSIANKSLDDVYVAVADALEAAIQAEGSLKDQSS